MSRCGTTLLLILSCVCVHLANVSLIFFLLLATAKFLHYTHQVVANAFCRQSGAERVVRSGLIGMDDKQKMGHRCHELRSDICLTLHD